MILINVIILIIRMMMITISIIIIVNIIIMCNISLLCIHTCVAFHALPQGTNGNGCFSLSAELRRRHVPLRHSVSPAEEGLRRRCGLQGPRRRARLCLRDRDPGAGERHDGGDGSDHDRNGAAGGRAAFAHMLYCLLVLFTSYYYICRCIYFVYLLFYSFSCLVFNVTSSSSFS